MSRDIKEMEEWTERTKICGRCGITYVGFHPQCDELPDPDEKHGGSDLSVEEE